MSDITEAALEPLTVLSWWNIGKCLPNYDPRNIARKIKAFMERKGFVGTMILNAVAANKDTISVETQKVFNELTSGVNFHHLINQRDEGDACDLEIIHQIHLWIERNPAPAVIMLICVDHGFAELVRYLKELGYTFVVVCSDHAEADAEILRQLTPFVFYWEDIVGGKTLLEQSR